MIANILGGLAGQVIGLFGAKGKAQQQNIQTRMALMQRTWVDELLVVFWFAPSIVSWVSPEKADAMITSMMGNSELTLMQGAITAAVFGLGKVSGKR